MILHGVFSASCYGSSRLGASGQGTIIEPPVTHPASHPTAYRTLSRHPHLTSSPRESPRQSAALHSCPPRARRPPPIATRGIADTHRVGLRTGSVGTGSIVFDAADGSGVVSARREMDDLGVFTRGGFQPRWLPAVLDYYKGDPRDVLATAGPDLVPGSDRWKEPLEERRDTCAPSGGAAWPGC
jgi:hypothetical protein